MTMDESRAAEPEELGVARSTCMRGRRCTSSTAWCRAPSSSATFSRSTWTHSATSPASTPCTCSATSAPTQSRWRGRGHASPGLDFSPGALEVGARSRGAVRRRRARLSRRSSTRRSNVLGREQFDLVYTGVGSLGWLPDITGWARDRRRAVASGRPSVPARGPPDALGLDRERDDRTARGGLSVLRNGGAGSLRRSRHVHRRRRIRHRDRRPRVEPRPGRDRASGVGSGPDAHPPRRARLRGVEGARLDGSRWRRPLALTRPPRAAAGDVHPRRRASPASSRGRGGPCACRGGRCRSRRRARSRRRCRRTLPADRRRATPAA